MAIEPINGAFAPKFECLTLIFLYLEKLAEAVNFLIMYFL